MSKTVLLTRSNEDNKVLKKILNKKNYTCFELSLIKHVHKPFDSRILDNFTDIIITSKRAANITPIVKNGLNINAWVVGKTSASMLQEKGYNVQYIASSANDLITVLPNNAMIYLAGNNITTEMPSFVKTVEVYKVNYKDNLANTEIKLLKSSLDYILLYSENCAKALINLIVKNNLLKYLENSVVIAISSKVAKILESYFKNVVAAASPEQILEELEYYDRKKSTKVGNIQKP